MGMHMYAISKFTIKSNMRDYYNHLKIFTPVLINFFIYIIYTLCKNNAISKKMYFKPKF